MMMPRLGGCVVVLLLGACLVVQTVTAFAPPTRRSSSSHQSNSYTARNPFGSGIAIPSSSTTTTTVPILLAPRRRQTTTTTTALGVYSIPKNPGIELAGLIYDSTEVAFSAWEWTAGIGAPAALVAGAVLVTLGETREDTAPKKSDSPRTRFLKRTMRFCLLTSFAMEVLSIFIATMTGSVLLGHGEHTVAKKLMGYASPLQLLHHHHEFEYLTIQICFLQGLFNWLGAVAIELVLPRDNETKSARRMNRCLAGWLMSMVVWMLGFYNHHLSFYSDYASMIKKFLILFWKDYFWVWPVRPLALIYGPAMLYSLRLTWKAFRSPPELDD